MAAKPFDLSNEMPELSQEKKDSLSEEKNSSGIPICRICLEEEDEENEHELISPCICSGSLKYIGLHCLKSWLENKRHCKETQAVNSYIWKGLECEICKTPFKDTFRSTKGKELQVLNYVIHENSNNYMVIESVT